MLQRELKSEKNTMTGEEQEQHSDVSLYVSILGPGALHMLAELDS